MIETTDEHFQFFVKSVLSYCDKLKISGWHVRFYHEEIENGFALTRTDDAIRIAELINE